MAPLDRTQRLGGALLVAASLLLSTAPVRAQDPPLVRFGAIADPQYAPVPPEETRYYANSLWKLAEAVEALNALDLDFVVTLGDVIDRHVDSFTHILPVYRRLDHEHWFLLGNHDYYVHRDYTLTVPAFLGLEERYYDRLVGGVRFIVLDGNDLSLFANSQGTPRHAASLAMYQRLVAAGAVNAHDWNGGLSEQQLAWLEDRLQAARAAGEPVIVLGHYPLYPEQRHALWNHAEVRALLARYGNVVAYLNGHNNAGGYAAADGIHYVTLEGMLETATETAYAVVEVYEERLVIEGLGRVTDRVLPIPAYR